MGMVSNINAGVDVTDRKSCVRCSLQQVFLADPQSSWLEVGKDLNASFISNTIANTTPFPSLRYPYVHVVVVERVSWTGMTFAMGLL